VALKWHDNESSFCWIQNGHHCLVETHRETNWGRRHVALGRVPGKVTGKEQARCDVGTNNHLEEWSGLEKACKELMMMTSPTKKIVCQGNDEIRTGEFEQLVGYSRKRIHLGSVTFVSSWMREVRHRYSSAPNWTLATASHQKERGEGIGYGKAGAERH